MWRDAAIDTSHEAGINRPSELVTFGGMVLCRDIGWLISKNRKEVVLAVGQCLDDESIRHSNTIPRGWIKEIIYLTNPFEPINAITDTIPNEV